MSEASEFKVIEVHAPERDQPLHVLRRNVEEDDAVQVNLFDEDYTLAAATGFTIWPGSHVMLRFLTAPSSLQEAGGMRASGEDVRSHLGSHLKGRRIVELGSGIGLLGLALAAHGAHVLMTDVQPIVEDILQLNIAHNRDDDTTLQGSQTHTAANTAADTTTTVAGEEHTTPPVTTTGTQSTTSATSPPTADTALSGMSSSGEGADNGAQAAWRDAPSRGNWPDATCINKRTGGTAACTALDWTKDVRAQTQAMRAWETDVIIAAETIWLKELVLPFVRTICGLLEIARREQGARACASSPPYCSTAQETVETTAPAEPLCLLAYTNRGHTASETFAVTEEVLAAFADNGCVVTPIHTEMVDQGDQEEEGKEDGKRDADQDAAESQGSHSRLKRQKPCDAPAEGKERKPCTIYRIQLSGDPTPTTAR